MIFVLIFPSSGTYLGVFYPCLLSLLVSNHVLHGSALSSVGRLNKGGLGLLPRLGLVEEGGLV